MAEKRQTAPSWLGAVQIGKNKWLALARLEARVGLVDDIDPALAADELVVAMALHQTLEGVANFHNTPVWAKARLISCCASLSYAIPPCQPPLLNTCSPVPETLQNIEFLVTLAVVLVACALVAGMAWLESRPKQTLQPSLIPTTPVMLLGMLVGILAVVHLLNLAGIRTGR